MSSLVSATARDTHHPATATSSTQLQTAGGEMPKLTVRVTPLVRVSRGDARGVVVVTRHKDNRLLRVILESEDYYSLSEVQLEGEDAPQSHSFYWRDLPPGAYCVTVHVYGTGGLRDSTSIGSTALMTKER
jgi:hypothetical protein